MHRSRLFILILLGLAVPGIAGCGAAKDSTGPQAVTLAMGYVPNVQFTPFYVAVAKGYFAEEGIDITFDYGWETDLLKLVGSDELQFAIASGDQVILARSQELPVVYVLNWYRRFPVCVMSLPEAGVQEPADLVGKRVGTPVTYGASYIGWRALAQAAGLEETDVQLVTVGYNQVGALTEHQVDAALCYAMNEPVQMRSAGQAVDVIYVSDYANLVSNGLITNDETVRSRPELVQGMVRASLRGIAYTLAHPDESFEITVKAVPEVAGDEAARQRNRAILDESIAFWQATAAELGRSAESEWQASQQIMVDMGLVSADSNVSTMFTNEFIVEVDE